MSSTRAKHRIGSALRPFDPDFPARYIPPLIRLPMALTSGTRLGPYEILAPIGAGGMDFPCLLLFLALFRDPRFLLLGLCPE